jgi:hypothetical protein
MVSGALDNFIAWLSWLLPNFSVFDFTLEAAHGLPIVTDRLLIALGYGVLYSVVLLFLASLIFSHREFN